MTDNSPSWKAGGNGPRASLGEHVERGPGGAPLAEELEHPVGVACDLAVVEQQGGLARSTVQDRCESLVHGVGRAE